MTKFTMKCNLCGTEDFQLSEWIANKQRCPQCDGDFAEFSYESLPFRLRKAFVNNGSQFPGMWRYFDVLPLQSKENVVTALEGNVQIDRWQFLEKFAKEFFSVDCKVFAHRHDNNNATGSFKDLAGSIIASVLKENSIDTYVVATTGNIGVACARYMAGFGGTLYAFIPETTSKYKEAEISVFGQKVFRVLGDYTRTKALAKEFADEHCILYAAGTFDPMRVEAKKTMAFEWFKRMEEFPTVYIQALSGGTGVVGIHKGCRELIEIDVIKHMPRMLLVQSSRCAPMADAWASAKQKGFLKGWEEEYPVYDNPITIVPTLATGNPTAYPIISRIVRDSGGAILSFSEKLIAHVAKLVAFETAVRIGPAAAVALGGFFSALQNSSICSGDIVLINIGEGVRREPGFMAALGEISDPVNTLNECRLFDRTNYGKLLADKLQFVKWHK